MQQAKDLTRYKGRQRSELIEILWDIQKSCGGISKQLQSSLAEQLNLSTSTIEEVVTFYHFFSEEYRGKNQIYLDTSIIAQHSGMKEIRETFEKELGSKIGGLSSCGTIGLFETACIGMSDQSPAALIDFVPFPKLTPKKVDIIVKELKAGVSAKEIAKKFGLGDGANASKFVRTPVCNNIQKKGDVFFTKWKKGEAVSSALSKKPNEVIDMITASGLRGRGGAGFPTGMKWKIASDLSADQKYIVCNADEGEPGTFKDRLLLTEFAGLLIEGMKVASYAVGADKGFIYLRAEYFYLRDHLEKQIKDLESKGLLKDFKLKVKMGAGAYVCGEESALLESLEGKRGEPRMKPPFPVEVGLFGKPTIVNNVETFVLAAQVMRYGPQHLNKMGTEKSKGPRLLSISGDVEKPGIYEFPWGVTVAEVLKICGAKNPKIVQVGGPSGTCISKNDFVRQLAFEDLPTGGSFMVFDESRDLFEILENFMQFFVDESCGNCTPCRAGNVILRDLLKKINLGKARPSDLQKMIDWGTLVSKTSRCGLGMSSPNVLLSSFKSFEDEFKNKIKNSDELFFDFDEETATKEYREFHRE